MRNRRGSVLVHVLITTVIVIVIATGLAQMLMMRYAATLRATDGVSKRRADEGTLSRLTSYWSTNGWCTSPGGSPAIACTLNVNNRCNANDCTCTVAGIAGNSIAVTGGTWPSCKITINSAP